MWRNLLVCLLAISNVPVMAQAATVVALGSLAGGDTFPRGLNNRSQVVGISRMPDGKFHGFLWQNGQMIDLGTLGGDTTFANAVNDRGQVVGGSNPAGASYQVPFLWENGGMVALGTEPGQATAINARGQVVGSRGPAPGAAFFWSNGAFTDIGFLDAGNWSVARAINNRAQVAFWSRTTTATSPIHAAIWTASGTTVLSAFEGAAQDFSQAFAINDRAQVVGFSTTSSGATHAALWENGTITDLDTTGSSLSSAQAINNRGQVAGYFRAADGQIHAFVWERGEMVDLGTFGGTTSSAWAINERGQVAVQVTVGGVTQALLVEP
jgi:probable HAF family extracellular repeat protein